MKLSKVCALFVVTAFTAVGFQAYADEVAAPAAGQTQAAAQGQHHKGKHKEMKQVFEACAKANSVALPEKGSGQRLSAGDHAVLHACVQRFHDDMKACLGDSGLQRPAPGEARTPPTDAQKAAFKACRVKSVQMISQN